VVPPVLCEVGVSEATNIAHWDQLMDSDSPHYIGCYNLEVFEQPIYWLMIIAVFKTRIINQITKRLFEPQDKS